jgi:hypothetical protein
MLRHHHLPKVPKASLTAARGAIYQPCPCMRAAELPMEPSSSERLASGHDSGIAQASFQLSGAVRSSGQKGLIRQLFLNKSQAKPWHAWAALLSPTDHR